MKGKTMLNEETMHARVGERRRANLRKYMRRQNTMMAQGTPWKNRKYSGHRIFLRGWDVAAKDLE